MKEVNKKDADRIIKAINEFQNNIKPYIEELVVKCVNIGHDMKLEEGYVYAGVRKGEPSK